MALPCRDGLILALRAVKKCGNPVGNRGGVFVRIGLIEIVGVEEGRVNPNGTHPSGARHAHVIKGVTEVGRLSGCRRMTKSGEAASKRRRIRLLFDGVVTVDRRTDQIGDARATELTRNDLAIASGDDAEGDPRGDQSLKRWIGAGEELRFVPLISVVPDACRSLYQVLGDTEGGVHAAPVRREGGPIALTSEGREPEGLHHLNVRLIDVFGRVNQGPIPVKQHSLHGLSVRRA